jgi:hypothetical protein
MTRSASLPSIFVSISLATLGLAACSSGSSSPPATAKATLTGPSGALLAVRSAALIESGTILDSGNVGAPTTYVEFFADPPGTACSELDAGSISVAGSLSVPGSPASNEGRVLSFGTTGDLYFTLPAGPFAGDASLGLDAGDGGPSLVAVSGTIKLADSSGALTGTVDVQMVLASDPGGPTVAVTGTFTAPSCGQ